MEEKSIKTGWKYEVNQFPWFRKSFSCLRFLREAPPDDCSVWVWRDLKHHLVPTPSVTAVNAFKNFYWIFLSCIGSYLKPPKSTSETSNSMSLLAARIKEQAVKMSHYQHTFHFPRSENGDKGICLKIITLYLIFFFLRARVCVTLS